MSRINELIERLCPDGADSIQISEVLEYKQPTRYIVTSINYDDSFPTPVLTAGQSFILGYTDEVDGIYSASKEKPVIIFDDFTTSFHWVDFPFKVKSSAMKFILPKEDAAIDFRFVYYAMKCITYNPQDHARQWISVYSNFYIPIPPLQIQNEIVKTLDLFIELKVELEAELEARKKQFTFYRDMLLDFEGKNVKWKTLGSISKYVTSGGTPLANKTEYYASGNIPWLRTQEVRFNEIYTTAIKITDLALKQTSVKWIPANCVIIAISGATAGRSAINKIPLTTNQHCCNLDIDPAQANYRYVFHWVNSRYEQLKSLGQGARSDLNSSRIRIVFYDLLFLPVYLLKCRLPMHQACLKYLLFFLVPKEVV